MLSALRAARRPRDQDARDTTSDEPNGLMDLLQNQDFLPAELRADDAVRNESDDMYDDLPPLEDSGPSTSRTERPRSPVDAPVDSSDSEDDLPSLDPQSPSSSSSRLSTRDVGLPITGATPSDVRASSPSVREAVHEDAAASSSSPSGPPIASSPGSRTRSRRPRATSSPQAAALPADNEDGADSDSSMPTLQTVSDSSDDEEDSYVASDEDWDDTDDFYSSDQFDDDDEDDTNGPPFPSNHPSHTSREPNSRRPALFDLLPNFASNMTTNSDDLFQSFRDMLARASSVPASELRALDDADHTRADAILAGLEKVPTELVRRYEKLRAAEGQNADGCAICRDDLCAEENIVSLYAVLPFHPEACHPEASTVFAFPCAGKHLFHGDCLSPWLARKTTCPSCRFDIDPHSLTLKRNREGPNAGLDSQGGRTRVWQPPQVESMSDWLDAEERARAIGVPRQRPQPVIPRPGPAATGSHTFASGLVAALAGTDASGTLAQLLDSPRPDSPSTDWHYDPNTGTIDILAAFRSISEMRQAYLEADPVERQRLEGLIRGQDAALADAGAPPVQVPDRPPSAPPILLSEVTPGLLATPSPAAALPAGIATSPTRGRTLAEQLEHAIIGNAEPPSASVQIPPAIAEHFARERAEGRRVAIVMPPVEDSEPGLVELLMHLNTRLREAHLNGPPQTAPTSFEDVAGAPPAEPTGEVDAEAPDAADVPPPIQADPNQALHAEAPLELEEEYTHALLTSGLVGPQAGDGAPQDGNNWIEDLD
ncbi:hypothetical protein VTO73DRAFT_5611 [Trametes versicolor]